MNGNSAPRTKFTRMIPISNRYMRGVVTAAVCNTNLAEKNLSMQNTVIVPLVKSFTVPPAPPAFVWPVFPASQRQQQANNSLLQGHLSNGLQYSTKKTLTSHTGITTSVGMIVERKPRSINCLVRCLVRTAGAQLWTREET